MRCLIQRKEPDSGLLHSDSRMNNQTIRNTVPAPMWTVAEVIDRCPQAASVFTRFRMACLGCPMAPFETLGEAVAVYRIGYEEFLHALRFADSGDVPADNSKEEDQL